jgi:hypothetical protein
MCVLIRSGEVENLGFDVVRFLYHLALALLIGGGGKASVDRAIGAGR